MLRKPSLIVKDQVSLRELHLKLKCIYIPATSHQDICQNYLLAVNLDDSVAHSTTKLKTQATKDQKYIKVLLEEGQTVFTVEELWSEAKKEADIIIQLKKQSEQNYQVIEEFTIHVSSYSFDVFNVGTPMKKVINSRGNCKGYVLSYNFSPIFGRNLSSKLTSLTNESQKGSNHKNLERGGIFKMRAVQRQATEHSQSDKQCKGQLSNLKSNKKQAPKINNETQADSIIQAESIKQKHKQEVRRFYKRMQRSIIQFDSHSEISSSVEDQTLQEIRYNCLNTFKWVFIIIGFVVIIFLMHPSRKT